MKQHVRVCARAAARASNNAIDQRELSVKNSALSISHLLAASLACASHHPVPSIWLPQPLPRVVSLRLHDDYHKSSWRSHATNSPTRPIGGSIVKIGIRRRSVMVCWRMLLVASWPCTTCCDIAWSARCVATINESTACDGSPRRSSCRVLLTAR